MEKLSRKSGVLLHISSLPNEYGLGTFSCKTKEFIDFLACGKFGVWQILPITDCGYGLSPYSAVSTFAINPYFLDLTKYLSGEEINSFSFDKRNDNLTEEQDKYDKALNLVYEKLHNDFDISKFKKSNAYWLDDYAMFKVLKSHYEGSCWSAWKTGHRDRIKADLDSFKLKNKAELDKIKFIQFLLDKDWKEIKEYAKNKGIEIFGDIPMYVEYDSADVWANPKNWQLENGKPKAVAGVPPDYFNCEGQLWGNPLYNYTHMAKNKYNFWVKRIKRQSEMLDILRLDHFIAIAKYFAIPSSSTTAKSGKWVKGPGANLLKTIQSKCKIKLIAEDLGIVTEDVTSLREKFNIPGLKVMQFAFDEEGDNMYQPHNYEKNCVAYIGTHDNNTFMGLLNEGDWDKINRFKRYLNMPLEYGNDAVIDNTILALYKSSANLIILTMQDILKLGSEARMNIPGVPEGNWLWQLGHIPDMGICARYKYLSDLYARN